MTDDAARSRLGRGLAALMGDVGGEAKSNEHATRNQRKVPIEHVRANPRNPRKLFSDAELNELSASIKERGIIQPIVVRGRGPDNYEIIAGERRWRAAQRAGLHEVPIVALDVSDSEALELAIIENVQRSDLNPLEEAGGYLSLANEFNHSQDDIAKIVGKSRSHVANTLRLLHLPERVKAYINSGKLTAGHARMLVGQPNAGDVCGPDRQPGSERPPGRGDGAQERPAAGTRGEAHRPDGQGRRHRGAGESADECAGPAGDDRPPRQRRRLAAGALQDAGAARRRCCALGAGAEDRGHRRQHRHAPHQAAVTSTTISALGRAGR